MEMSESNRQKTVFITGGGTGGHIYPAIAVANALREAGCKIFYVGNPKNLEKEIAQKEGFDFLGVDISGMPRRADFGVFKWMWKLFVATSKALGYILKYKPDMVFGTGGYVSAPALFASVLTKTPFATHDCDAAPGIVSKTVAPFAKFVSLAFEGSKNCVKSRKSVCFGNPIRKEFSQIDKIAARGELNLLNKPTLLVMGGSQGAKTLNKALIYTLEDLFKEFDIQIIHQTGRKNYDETLEMLEKIYPAYKENNNYILRPYFDRMFTPLIAADIAFTRAGSLSISELCAAGAASILVPYPYAAADHQRKNAREMEKHHAAIYLEDRDCNSANLYKILRDLFNSPTEITLLQEKAKSLAKPYATREITAEILNIINC